jgi:serine protease Do
LAASGDNPEPRRKKDSWRPTWTQVLVLTVVAAIALAVGAAVVRRAAGPAPVTRESADRPLTLAQIFERVAPAVVAVEVADRGPSIFRFGTEPQGPQGQPESRTRASGSGFFVSADGLVITNNHVIDGAREIVVALHDGRRLTASVVGRDETIDLALLRVADPNDRAARFPYVELAHAARPRVGDWVLAVGNPFGLGGTATAGIVSAFGREIGAGGLVEYLQLDAAINRGDMGGPSFDIYGRVIGVNTAILSPSGGSIGISFAIPADTVAAAVKQLSTGRAIVRGFIGASIQTLDSEAAAAQGIPGQKGALIAQVSAGGPAARAGLRPGDVVISVDGEAVETSAELTRKVAAAGPDRSLRLAVLREGKPVELTVRTGTRPPPRELQRAF